MEGNLFTWEKYDRLAADEFFFYQCVLVKDIWSFNAGHCVDSIYVNYGYGIMELYDEDDNTLATFKLGLVVLPE